MRVCLSAEGAKNVSWPWLSLLSGWGSLTMAFIGKVVYISVKAMRKPIYIIFTSRYSFIRPIYGQCFYYITLRTTEKTLLVFEGSQRMLGGSSWQKWVSHWQEFMGYRDFFGWNRWTMQTDTALQICMDLTTQHLSCLIFVRSCVFYCLFLIKK